MCMNRYGDMHLETLKVDLEYQKEQNVLFHFPAAVFNEAAAEDSVLLRMYQTFSAPRE